MSYLKKFGTIVAAVAKIAIGVGSFLPKEDGKVKDVIDSIAAIILIIESMGQSLNTSGADKLKAATPLVAQVMLQSELMHKKKIENPELFRSGCESIADGMAKILNSIKNTELKLEDIPS